MNKHILVIAFFLISTRVYGLDIVLQHDASHAEIIMSDYPGSSSKVLVSWKKISELGGDGTMVYSTEKGDNVTRYSAVGGGGFLSIIDQKEKTLINGTLVSVFSVVVSDPQHPLKMTMTKSPEADGKALLNKYHQYESIAEKNESQGDIQKAIDAMVAQTNKTCGSHLTSHVKWASFETKNLPYAKQAVAVLEGVSVLCKDKDYKEAVAKIGKIEFEHLDGLSELKIQKDGGRLTVQLGAGSFNPRESTPKLLEATL